LTGPIYIDIEGSSIFDIDIYRDAKLPCF